MKRLWLCIIALGLLAGCGAPAAESPVPETDIPAAPGAFVPHAVDEEILRQEYAEAGYEVLKTTPYRGDFVVEYSLAPEEESHRGRPLTGVDWVYGKTGRRAELWTGEQGLYSYEVIETGKVRFYSEFYRIDGLYHAVPTAWEMTLRYDGEGNPRGGDYRSVEREEILLWLDPREELYTGPVDPEKAISAAASLSEEDGPVGRVEQLYDARLTVDGLSFSFIPRADSIEEFGSFFPAATSAPYWRTDFDGETGLFTLRLREVSLSCGTLTREEWDERGTGEYDHLYPYTFPEGSLGRDSHFLTGVEIHQDGEDAVVTGYLTDRAGSFRVEQGNLGEDNIPKLRLIFREQGPEEGDWYDYH